MLKRRKFDYENLSQRENLSQEKIGDWRQILLQKTSFAGLAGIFDSNEHFSSDLKRKLTAKSPDRARLSPSKKYFWIGWFLLKGWLEKCLILSPVGICLF